MFEDYPHSLKPTFFVGFIPVTSLGEAGKGRSAPLLGQICQIMSALPTCQMAGGLVLFTVKPVQAQREWPGSGARIKLQSRRTTFMSQFWLWHFPDKMGKTVILTSWGCLENWTRLHKWEHQIKGLDPSSGCYLWYFGCLRTYFFVAFFFFGKSAALA